MFRTITISLVAFAFSLALTISPAVKAQEAELLSTMGIGDLTALGSAFGIPPGLVNPSFEVSAYRVTYDMPFLDSVVSVSGALFTPLSMDLACGAPTMTYMHGTMFVREDAPSFLGSEGQLGFLMASLGFVTLMPDYVGLGTSDLLHPYIHAQSEADAGVYFLEAASVLSEELGYTMGTENFVMGYSQGGHAAMAMAREMQTNWNDEFPLTAAAPMSGPYDLSGTQFPMGFAQESYSNPAYMAYTALAWQSIYGNLYNDLSDWFLEPYASEIPGMFDGMTSGGAINDYLPTLTADVIQPGLLESLLEEGSPFLAAAQDNDVYEWVPESPIQMYYCTMDEQVFYENALLAETHMNDAGASAITTINGGPLTHGGCALLAILGGTLWSAGQADFCSLVGVDEQGAGLALNAFPNPTSGDVRIEGLAVGSHWTLLDASGRTVFGGVAEASLLDMKTAQLASGLYTFVQGASAVRIAVQ